MKNSNKRPTSPLDIFWVIYLIIIGAITISVGVNKGSNPVIFCGIVAIVLGAFIYYIKIHLGTNLWHIIK
jgi:uncharacterized protein with PQ loop repeat